MISYLWFHMCCMHFSHQTIQKRPTDHFVFMSNSIFWPVGIYYPYYFKYCISYQFHTVMNIKNIIFSCLFKHVCFLFNFTRFLTINWTPSPIMATREYQIIIFPIKIKKMLNLFNFFFIIMVIPTPFFLKWL